jgi:hypothetical protein
LSLVLIAGGRAPFSIGGARIHLAQEDERLPFVVDAVAVEQDRYLALSPPPEVIDVVESPLKTMTRALDVAALPVGTVHMRPGEPSLMSVVVVDVDEDPVCTPAWVEQGARALVSVLVNDGFTRVRLPLLGTAHGGVSAKESAEAIGRAIASAPDVDADRILHVALVVPRAHLVDVRDALAAFTA